MPYVDRDQGRIVGKYACQQREGQEYVEGDVELQQAFSQSANLQLLRATRSPILNALAGIGFDSIGDPALVAAVKAARQGLKDMTAHPAILAATSDAEFKAAVKARYAELVAAAPLAVRVAFKESA